MVEELWDPDDEPDEDDGLAADAEPMCVHHPQTEAWDQNARYCSDCCWALRVVEEQLTFEPKPENERSTRYFYVCPEEHAFTSKASGADKICPRCKDRHEKNSVGMDGSEAEWPSLTEMGPIDLRIADMPHVRGLVVRVDPNALDLQYCYHQLSRSLQAESLRTLLTVAQELLQEVNAGRCTKSWKLNKIFRRRDGPEQLLEALTGVVRACRLVLDLTGDRDVDVVYKKKEKPFSEAPAAASNQSFLGYVAWHNSRFRDLTCAVEVKGERRRKGLDLDGGFRGLRVNKENHLVFLVTRGDAAQLTEELSRFPFQGLMEQLRRKHASQHDQLLCQACDFLGRHCGASNSKAIAHSFTNGAKLILKGAAVPKSLPAMADEDFVTSVIHDVESAARALDPTAAWRWKLLCVRPVRDRPEDKLAVIQFSHSEICSQVCERAKDVLRQRLLAAESAVPRASLEAGPGLLYAAEPVSEEGGHACTALEVRSVVRREGSKCLGWCSSHQRHDLPKIRLISAPHWLRQALNMLPGTWRLYRLTWPYQIFQLLDRNFVDDMPEGWVQDIHSKMRLRPIDSLDDAANFLDHGVGLQRMGEFPSMNGEAYKSEKFCPALDQQYKTLLRHVHLFGKPTSAGAHIAAWEPSTLPPDDDDRLGVDIEFDLSDDELGEATSATSVGPSGPSAPPSPSTQATYGAATAAAPVPEDEAAAVGEGPGTEDRRTYARAIADFDSETFQATFTPAFEAISLQVGDWVMWHETDPEPDDGWRKGFRWDSERFTEGWFPAAYVRTWDVALPLAKQAELASNSFARSFWLADGGTCDVYDVWLPSGRVAAKVLRSQESRVLVTAMHDESRLFQQEVEALRRLDHPYVVKILDSGETEDSRFVIVQEFVSPDNLLQLLPADAMTWQTRLCAASQLSQAISYIHSLGVIHRDIKSANVLVSFDQVADLTALKLSDFGLAKGVQDRELTHASSRQQSTRVCGTLSYLDPDSVRGHGSTKESDVYSFAIVLLDLVIGTGCGPKSDHYRHARRNTVSFHGCWQPAPSETKAAVLCLAKECVAEFREDRPEMAEVQRRLLDLQ